MSQISNSLNKLAANIEARGINDALMKRGEAIEYEDPSCSCDNKKCSAEYKKCKKFEVSSENNNRNPLFGGNDDRNLKQERIKMGSAKKIKTKRRFYSPTQARVADQFDYDENT